MVSKCVCGGGCSQSQQQRGVVVVVVSTREGIRDDGRIIWGRVADQKPIRSQNTSPKVFMLDRKIWALKN
jgi:hypothetical protein